MPIDYELKQKMALATAVVVYLNKDVDYPRWQDALRDLVTLFDMGPSLLYSFSRYDLNDPDFDEGELMGMMMDAPADAYPAHSTIGGVVQGTRSERTARGARQESPRRHHQAQSLVQGQSQTHTTQTHVTSSFSTSSSSSASRMEHLTPLLEDPHAWEDPDATPLREDPGASTHHCW